MNVSFYFRLVALILFFFCGGIISATGQIAVGALPYSYTNDFNNYAGSAATLPSGWTANSALVFRGRNNGSSATGGFWSYGTSASDGSMGTLRSGTAVGTYTVTFVNNSGATITSLTLSWDYEQWRFANTSGFDCSGTGALAGNAILDGKDLAGVASGSAGALTPVSSFTLSGLSIANGTSFGITWATTDASGADNGVAVDNFSISAAAAAAATAPVVTTTRATAIAINGITSGGNVTADGGAALSERGAAWAITATPTAGTASGSATGTYTTSITGLLPNTRYYYRAYATNSVGTAYGTGYDTVTRAAVPEILVDNSSANAESTIDFLIGENNNPDGTPGNATEYAIKENATNTWLQANGTLGAAMVWQPYAAWGATVTGLNANTQYCFQVKARNSNNIETALSTPAACVTTATPSGAITGISSLNDICNGSASNLNLSYTSTISSGTYTAQLSDASGSFASPATIGTGTSASGIAITIPAATTAGTVYRVRVVNNGIVSDTTPVFAIKATPGGTLAATPATLCPGTEAAAQLAFTATAVSVGPYDLSIKNVQTNTTVNYTGITSGTAFNVNATQLPAAGNTEYQLIQIAGSNGCVTP